MAGTEMPGLVWLIDCKETNTQALSLGSRTVRGRAGADRRRAHHRARPADHALGGGGLEAVPGASQAGGPAGGDARGVPGVWAGAGGERAGGGGGRGRDRQLREAHQAAGRGRPARREGDGRAGGLWYGQGERGDQGAPCCSTPTPTPNPNPNPNPTRTRTPALTLSRSWRQRWRSGASRCTTTLRCGAPRPTRSLPSGSSCSGGWGRAAPG
eukprot:scaffold51289_cov41-Phaeocystis_antarctica.AAC.1